MIDFVNSWKQATSTVLTFHVVTLYTQLFDSLERILNHLYNTQWIEPHGNFTRSQGVVKHPLLIFVRGMFEVLVMELAQPLIIYSCLLYNCKYFQPL